ncbi:unnamed protein product [Cuscuta campestris]|uniref:Uncharacterized protein n=1 Tax=Cuscuta campestris TaxID=132261 RepID=A0A484LKN1_9ASTE|nr:unnamed protein product [Cuscuta campestris]
MEFDSNKIPKRTGASSLSSSQATPAKNFKVQQETMEILSEEETKLTRAAAKNPSLDKWKKTWVKKGARLEEKVKEGEKRARDLSTVIMRQTHELAKLTKAVRSLGADNHQLKEENTRLMDEVSHLKLELKEALEEKERELLGRARVWIEENKAQAARVQTSTPKATMESFKLFPGIRTGRRL